MHALLSGPIISPDREEYIVPRNLPIGMILQLNNLYLPSGEITSCDIGDKVAQLVMCRTSNQRVAGSIPGHFGRSWAKQFIPYCFSLPSCKMGT